MTLPLQQFCNQLSRHGLMSTDELSRMVEKLTDADPAEQARQLARRLVKQETLTRFQAQQVLAEKADSLVMGNYLILDQLGQGGMGMVLKAIHRRMERIVAIKILSPKVTQSADLLQRFQREVRAAAKLDHPHIVTAYDADEANGTHFLVMQYVEGTDLSVLVKSKGPLSVDDAISYVVQAAQGLQYAHDSGLVHRDVKPANMLLDGSGIVRVLDMGLARFESGDVEQDAQLTGSGQVMGTVDYMAPEQAIDTHAADARADIYSLGATLYYFLTGSAMYAGETMASKLIAHQSAPVPSLPESCLQQCGALSSVFEKMVAKNPADRYQATSEVIRDLEACRNGDPIPLPMSSGDTSALNNFLKNLDAQPTAASADPEVTVIAPVVDDPEETFISASAGEDTSIVADFSVGAGERTPAQTAEPTRVQSAESLAAQKTSLPETQTTARAANRPSRRGNSGKGRGRKSPPWLWFGGVGLVALIVVAGIIIRIKNKDGSISEIKVPEGAAVLEILQDRGSDSEKSGKGVMKAGAAGEVMTEREIAEIVLELGGIVQIPQKITSAVELPADLFRVRDVRLSESVLQDPKSVTDDVIEKISGLQDLRCLDVLGAAVTDKSAIYLQRLASLEMLNLSQTEFTLSALKQIIPRENVIELGLGGINIGDDGTAVIASGFPRLTQLEVFDCQISDRGIGELAKLTSLEYLNLHDNPVSDAGLNALRPLANLEVLRLTGTEVTDDGLKILPSRSKLKVLYLGRAQVSDDGLEYLKSIPTLKSVDLRKTRVTANGIRDLRQALPNCDVNWDDTDPAAEPTTDR